MVDYRNTSDTIGTASLLLSSRGDRVELIIVNTSTAGQNITLSFDRSAVSKQGVYLPQGGYYYASSQNDFRVSPKDIYAISDAAGGILSVMERRV